MIIEELLSNEVSDEFRETQDDDSKFRCKNDDCEALTHWSCASTFFRNLIAPYIFKVVHLYNEDRSGTWLSALASGQSASLVKDLRFYCEAPEFTCERGQSGTFSYLAYPRGILPQSVQAVLSHLHLFPSLESLRIEFSEDSLALGYCCEEAPAEQYREAKTAWREMVAKTCQTMLKNKKIQVKSLDLHGLGYLTVSAIINQSLNQFLTHIGTFSLSLTGEKEYAGWEIDTSAKVFALASKLDKLFFDHLSHLTSITIKVVKECLFWGAGTTWAKSVPLALKKDQMPHLKHVHLEYMAVCPKLIDFLIGHTATLEHLSLRDCFVEVNVHSLPEPEIEIYWEDFFNMLCDANFRNLRQIEILPLNLPLTIERLTPYPNPRRAILTITEGSGPDRHLFAYAEMVNGNGIYPLAEFYNESFEQGKDQAAYDRLMRKVEAITAKSDVQDVVVDLPH